MAANLLVNRSSTAAASMASAAVAGYEKKRWPRGGACEGERAAAWSGLVPSVGKDGAAWARDARRPQRACTTPWSIWPR
jgi:hypothetical protein